MPGTLDLLQMFFDIDKSTRCHIDFSKVVHPNRDYIILELCQSNRDGSPLALRIKLLSNNRYEIEQLL